MASAHYTTYEHFSKVVALQNKILLNIISTFFALRFYIWALPALEFPDHDGHFFDFFASQALLVQIVTNARVNKHA